MKELIEITRQQLSCYNNSEISEVIAHEMIANKQEVLMIFERDNGTFYWYKATEFTDLWHWKKQTINDLVWFFKDNIN